MTRTDVFARERDRQLRPTAPRSTGDRGSTLAPRQARTCARCGRYATFVLEDPAGGWYACAECGRYA
jgi:hypothetical protein